MSPLSLRALSRGARRRSLIAPLLLAAPFALPAAAQAGTVTLDAVGCGGSGGVAANQWTVPAGVTDVRITLQGQPGATGGTPGTGGAGAYIVGTASVSPGDVLYGCVNIGGGAGGTAQSGASRGGDGGGYTAISKDADQSVVLAVAGGGGGGGGYYGIGIGGNGGRAGTIAPTAAGSNGMSTTDWPSARGGSGANGTWGAGGVNTDDTAFNGQNGALRRGGAGGNGLNGGPGGGGGGAGVWGGGGGAAAQGFMGTGGSAYSSGAGGGGGDSYCGLGDCRFATANTSANVTIAFTDPPTVTTTTVSTGAATATGNRQTTLRAVVSPAPAGGTVDFRVDGWSQYGCDAVAVDTTTGVAECRTTFPGERGTHRLAATYSGYTGLPTASAGSDDEIEFTVYAGIPSVTPSPTAEFGEVELGKSTTRPLTLTNVGDGDLTLDADESIYLAEYGPRARPPRSREFTIADDQCKGRVLAPNASCTVLVTYTPSALGVQRGETIVYSDAWSGADPVTLLGTGIAARPEPQPEERKPETPVTPAPTTPAAPAPAAPAAPAPTKPAETARTPPAVGASAPSSVARGAPVSETGGVKLPLICPPGQACSISGTLTLAITGGQARSSAAAKTRVLVRFSGIKVAAGKTKTLSLKLPAAFVKAQQQKGVRKLRTTLTVNTVLGNGQRVTRRQAVTLIIPRARAAQRAAPRQVERPAFTG